MATISNSPNSFPNDPSFRKQISILDENFNDVTLVKGFQAPPPITSVEDALSYLGGNKEKLLAIITQGLKTEAGNKAAVEPGGWYDKETKVLYEGVQLNSILTTPLVLNMAKTVFAGVYAEDREKAKGMVIDFLKSPAGDYLRKGLILVPTVE